jgi:hypothetical protein
VISGTFYSLNYNFLNKTNLVPEFQSLIPLENIITFFTAEKKDLLQGPFGLSSTFSPTKFCINCDTAQAVSRQIPTTVAWV